MEFITVDKSQKVLKFLVITFIGSIALALSAKIKIPFYPVPMTMQTFVVLFLGISFGYLFFLILLKEVLEYFIL